MSTIGSLQVEIGADISGLTKGLADATAGVTGASQEIEAAGSRMSQIWERFGGVIKGALASAAIGEAAHVLLGVGEQFEEAFNKIRVTTGQTGEAFDSLTDSFKTVLGTVTQDADTVAKALSTVSQRSGATGKDLEALTTSLLDLSRITGQSVEALSTSVTSAFRNWSVPIGQQVDALDALFRASQRTGISVSTLAGQLAFSGTTMRGFGLSIGESAQLLGQLEKAGVPVGQVLMSLRLAMGTFAKEGKTDFKAAFTEFETQVKAATSDAAAAQLGFDAFGKRAGPQLALLVREGKLSLADLAQTVGLTGDTIAKATADTTHWPEALKILQNEVKLAAEPLGTTFFEALNHLIPVGESFAAFLLKLSSGFAALPGPVQAGIGILFEGGAVIGPALLGMGALVKAFMAVKEAAIALNLVALLNPWVLAITAVVAASALIYANWDTIKTAGGALWASVTSTFTTALASIQRTWDTIRTAGSTAWTSLQQAAVQAMQQLYQGVQDWLVTRLTAVFERVKAPIEAVKGYFKGLYEAVVGHSYIPDMVTQTGQQMQRLHGSMVNPARAATRQTALEFQQLTGLTTQSLQTLSNAAIFTWGSIRTNFVQSLVGMMQGTATFQKFLQQAWTTILSAALNMIIEMGVQWALKSLLVQKSEQAELATHSAVESGKTAVSIAQEGVRSGMVLASNAAVVASAQASLAALSGVANGGLAMLTTLLEATVSVIEAIGSAVMAIPGAEAIGAEILAAGAELQATGAAALGAAAGGIQEALGSAVVATSQANLSTAGVTAGGGGLLGGLGGGGGLTSALGGLGPGAGLMSGLSGLMSGSFDALKTGLSVVTGGLSDLFGGFFAEGGIVTQPTLAILGEAGPEAVIPLTGYGGGGGMQQVIYFMMDSQALTRTVVKNMPRVVRMQLGNAI